jgi:hypothetical protein
MAGVNDVNRYPRHPHMVLQHWMKPGFGDDLPLIGGGAFLGRTVFKHYAHGFLVGRGEPDCGPGVGPAPADEASFAHCLGFQRDGPSRGAGRLIS